MVFRDFSGLVEETHVLGGGEVGVGLFVDDFFDSLEVFLVVVLLVEGGVQSAVGGAVVVECFTH